MTERKGAARRTRAWIRIGKAAAAIIVMAAALVYIAQALRNSWAAFTGIITEPAVLFAAGWLSVAYGACLFIVAGSWYMTLRRNTPIRVPAAQGAFIYCFANIAKYLPGNVFHFAGRQILGARAGWNHRAIAQASLLEIAAIVASISFIILVALAFGPSGLIDGIVPGAWRPVTHYQRLAGFSGLATAGLVFLAFARFRLFERLFGVPPITVLRASAMCAAFFCANAAMVIVFAQHIPTDSPSHTTLSIGLAYLIAWLAGFVVPGAPGGLGVRESMLVLLLPGTGETANAFALGLGFGMRFVSTLGDAVALGIAYAFRQVIIERNPERHRKTECI